MTREYLFEALGELDGDMVCGARETAGPRWRLSWGVLVPIAACLVLAVGALAVRGLPHPDGGVMDGESYAVDCEAPPMVCVGRGLYQIAIEQPELEGREDEFEYLGEITGRVDTAERPRESFSANDDLIGCSIYRLDEDIIVEYEGKYLLYELLYNYEDEE